RRSGPGGDPDGAPAVRAGGVLLPGCAGAAPAAHAGHGLVGLRARRIAAGAGEPGPQQHPRRPAAVGGQRAQRRRRPAAVHRGGPAGPVADAGMSHAAAYWELTKPRVVALIVFTAVIGMFLAIEPGQAWPWQRLLLGSLGIWLAAASAAAINHLLDQRIDAVMARTQHRPLATGSLRPAQVLAFALVLGIASMLVLCLGVNVFAAVLTFCSLIGYAVIYTGWLKRATPQNIVIGGLAGAAPPLLGWAAVRGFPAQASLAALWDKPYEYHYALLLVLIIYVWTPPHFWALAIFRREDYAKA